MELVKIKEVPGLQPSFVDLVKMVRQGDGIRFNPGEGPTSAAEVRGKLGVAKRYTGTNFVFKTVGGYTYLVPKNDNSLIKTKRHYTRRAPKGTGTKKDPITRLSGQYSNSLLSIVDKEGVVYVKKNAFASKLARGSFVHNIRHGKGYKISGTDRSSSVIEIARVVKK